MINIALLCALAFTSQAASTPPIGQEYTGPRKRAVVSGFDVLITAISVSGTVPSGTPPATVAQVPVDEPEELGAGFTEMLVTSLVASGKFIVLERKDMDKVKAELELQKGPGFDPTTALEVGKFMGAQVLIKGSITEMSFKKNSTSLGSGVLAEIVGGQANFIATVGIDLKMIDVETGQVLDSIRCEGRVGNKSTYIGFTSSDFAFGHSSFDNSPIAKAIRAAINDGVKKLGERLQRLPWEARVASVGASETETLLYLNFGELANVKVGTTLEVFRPGKTIIDPQTREVLGREDDLVRGTCRVRTVNAKFSVAVVESGSGFEIGDGVRIPEKTGG